MTRFSNKCLFSKLQKQQAHVKSISSVTVNAQNVRHLHLLKLAVDLRILSCDKSFQIFISADFSSGMSFGRGFR